MARYAEDCVFISPTAAAIAELVVFYNSDLAGTRTRACERMRFSGDLIVEDEALYGARV